MTGSERRTKGVEMIQEVYAGDVATPPEGPLTAPLTAWLT